MHFHRSKMSKSKKSFLMYENIQEIQVRWSDIHEYQVKPRTCFFADLFDKMLVLVSDLLKQLLMKVFVSFLYIVSGLFLQKCEIRLFGLLYVTIERICIFIHIHVFVCVLWFVLLYV